MLFKCSQCGLIKTRVPHANGRLFVDEKGRLWNSRACPPCRNKQIYRHRAQKRLLARKAKKLIVDRLNSLEMEQVALCPTPKRYCRKCNKLLPPTKYFYHDLCGPHMAGTAQLGFDEVYCG